MKKNYYLEFVRGSAALLVLITHFVILHPVLNKMGLNLFANWGTESVMIFFILSGLVIGLSQHKNPKSRNVFLLNRIVRLFPQFIIGILLAIGAFILLQKQIPIFKTIVGNIFMLSTLQGYLFETFITNSPIWSLTFEMFFYFIFACSISKYHVTFIFAWFVISLISIPLYFLKLDNFLLQHILAMLSFSSIWLLGYFIYRYRSIFTVNIYTAIFSISLLPLVSRLHFSNEIYDPFKFFIFAIISIPFFQYCIQERRLGKEIKFIYIFTVYIVLLFLLAYLSNARLYSKVLYAALPIISILFYKGLQYLGFSNTLKSMINQFGSTMGKYSFSIYIIHFPILFVLATWVTNPILFLTLSLFIVGIFAFILENYFQKNIFLLFIKWQKK